MIDFHPKNRLSAGLFALMPSPSGKNDQYQESWHIFSDLVQDEGQHLRSLCSRILVNYVNPCVKGQIGNISPMASLARLPKRFDYTCTVEAVVICIFRDVLAKVSRFNLIRY